MLLTSINNLIKISADISCIKKALLLHKAFFNCSPKWAEFEPFDRAIEVLNQLEVD